MEELPEGCTSNAMSLATPQDAGSLSSAESDALWDKFLPEDYRSLVARSSDPDLVERFPSKKELFLHLSHNPVLIDGGLKSFSLEKWSGKKRYMLSARELTIIWGDTPEYWVWIPEPRCRFTEVAELVDVCWLEIRGKIKTSMLSKNTPYTACFVFQLTTGTYGFECYPVEVSVGLVGREATKRTLHLDTVKIQSRRNTFLLRRRLFPRNHQASELQAPASAGAASAEKTAENNDCLKVREDGCIEIEMGNFFNGDGSEDEELEMCVLEVNHLHWKRGLIVYGIEIRPEEGK